MQKKFLVLLLLLGPIFSCLVSGSINELKLAVTTLPSDFDPQNLEGVVQMFIDTQIHAGLFRYKPNLETEPDLAKSFNYTQNNTVLNIDLENRTFSDGSKITAYDVVKTFKRMFKNKSGMSTDLGYIVGSEKLAAGDDAKDFGVVAINDKTVSFHLTHPTPFLLKLLATIDCSIIPLSKDLKYDGEKHIGAGPFKILSRSDREIVIDTWRSSLNSESELNRIRFIKLDNEDALTQALDGNIDSLDGFRVDEKTRDQLIQKGWNKTVTSLTSEYFISLNPEKLTMADRTLISEIVTNSNFKLNETFFKKAYGLIPDVIPGALGASDIRPSKPTTRKDLLETKLGFLSTDEVSSSLATEVATALLKFNIKAKLQPLTTEEYFGTLKAKSFDLLLRVKHLDYPDGFSILTYFKSNYVANNFFVADKQVDADIDKAQYILDLNERVSMYKKIQSLILKHKTILPVAFGSDNIGLWNLKRFEVPPHPMGLHSLLLSRIKVR